MDSYYHGILAATDLPTLGRNSEPGSEKWLKNPELNVDQLAMTIKYLSVNNGIGAWWLHDFWSKILEGGEIIWAVVYEIIVVSVTMFGREKHWHTSE